jgi:thymidylate kinase
VTRVFIEGLPGAGKTTTSKLLRQQGIPVARDFGLAQGADDYPGNGTTVNEILAIDDWFIRQEAERMKSTRGIFDRSYLGNLTYAYAYGRLLGVDSLRHTVKKYEHAIEIGKLALPEGLVYIDIEPELSIERQHQRVNEGIPLLDDFWRDRFFLQDLRDSHVALFDACGDIPLVTLDGEAGPPTVAHSIASFYTKLETAAPASTPRMDLDQYLADLEKLQDD